MEVFAGAPVPVIILLAVIIIASIIAIGWSYLKNRTFEEIRSDVYRMFLTAEHTFTETEAGKQKMKWVVSKARLLLPDWMRAFVSDMALENVIEMWFRQIKDLLDDGKVNGSQKGKTE